MFGNRSVSPMQARREALACGILQIHSDFFMAVHGHRKTNARLISQGWDSGEVGRDQVMRTMSELGVWGVRRGRTPAATRPARGTGDGPVRQRHGRIRRRRVQDRAGMEMQNVPRPGRSGTGDVPVGLVAELEAAAPVIGLRDTGRGGNRVLCKSSGTSRLTMKAEQKSGHITGSLYRRTN